MRKAIDALTKLLAALMAATLLALMVPVSLQILARHTPLVPVMLWTEEVARFLFIWLVTTGAMVGLRLGVHFEIDLFPKGMSPRFHALIRLIGHLLVGAFSLAYLVYGTEYAQFGFAQTSEIAGLPMVYMFMGWPISGAVWLVFLAEMISDEFRSLLKKGE